MVGRFFLSHIYDDSSTWTIHNASLWELKCLFLVFGLDFEVESLR